MTRRPVISLAILGTVTVITVGCGLWVSGAGAQIVSPSNERRPLATSAGGISSGGSVDANGAVGVNGRARFVNHGQPAGTRAMPRSNGPRSNGGIAVPEPWPYNHPGMSPPPAPPRGVRPSPAGTQPEASQYRPAQSPTGTYRPAGGFRSADPRAPNRGTVNNAAYYQTAVTSRASVSANQWAGPRVRPVQPIRQVTYEFDETNREDGQEGAVPAQSLLGPFEQRASAYPTQPDPVAGLIGQLAELPSEYAPWWDAVVNQATSLDRQSMSVNVESLILKAMEHSPQVTALRIDPEIRETAILEEYAEFDWTAFLETTFDRSSDPVGNSLTVGPGATRYRDNNLSSRSGVRKKFDQGLQFDVSQRIGHQRNNSVFLVPNPQGTARLELNFTQPLLRGAGRTVNQSRVVLAMIDRNIANRELIDRLQDHLVAVYQTYWSLYRARAIRLQKLRLLDRAAQIQKMLEARQGVDSLRRQVLRARAAVASRRSEIVRADTAIRNAESQLRLLVNSPELKQGHRIELLPAELPMSSHLDVSLRGSIETALSHRPDVAAAIQKMKAHSLRLGVAKNDLLPKLDFVLGTYVAGLRSNGEVEGAVRRQFTEGEPGYTVGLVFEFPLGNRAAKARAQRRAWELSRSLKEFEATVEGGMTEVELAVRELETAYQEMLSRFQAMLAAETEANYLLERWQHIPGGDQTTSFLLEDLLDAQERVATEEADFVNAQVDYVLAVISLKQATGILLSCDGESDVFGGLSGLADMTDQIPVTLPAPAPRQ